MTTEQDNQSSIELLFPTPIYIGRFDGSAAINDEISTVILAMEQEDPLKKDVYQDEFMNGYTSYFSRNALMNDDRFRPIADFILSQVEKFAGLFGYDMVKYKPKLIGMWANIQYEKGTHAKHIHRNALFSGAYYVKTPPNSAAIKFHDPKLLARMAEMEVSKVNMLNHLEAPIEAQEGRVVIFPAYLVHEVTVHKSPEPRISISFNANLFSR